MANTGKGAAALHSRALRGSALDPRKLSSVVLSSGNLGDSSLKNSLFHPLLGFISSLFAETLTGGSQNGHPFRTKEAVRLNASLQALMATNLRNSNPDLFKALSALVLFTEALQTHGQAPVDPKVLRQTIEYSAVYALRTIRAFEQTSGEVINPGLKSKETSNFRKTKMEKRSDPNFQIEMNSTINSSMRKMRNSTRSASPFEDDVYEKAASNAKEYLLACKIIAVATMYCLRAPVIELNFKRNFVEPAFQAPTLPGTNSDALADEFLALKTELGGVAAKVETLMLRISGSPVVSEAFKVLELASNVPGQNSSSALFQVPSSPSMSPDMPTKALRKGSSQYKRFTSLTDQSPDHQLTRKRSMQTSALTPMSSLSRLATTLGLGTKGINKIGNGFFRLELKSAKAFIRTLFMLVRMLNTFTGIPLFITPNSNPVRPDDLPEVFQETFSSNMMQMTSQKQRAGGKIMAVNLTVSLNCSAILYSNGIVELFSNADKNVIAHMQLNLEQNRCVAEDLVLCLDDSRLYIGNPFGNLSVFDVPSLVVASENQFNQEYGAITSLVREYGVLFIGFQNGLVRVWEHHMDTQIEFQVLQQEVEDDMLVQKQYQRRVVGMAVDEFSGMLAVAFEGGLIKFWDRISQSGTAYFPSLINSKHGEITAMTAKNGELYTGGTDGNILVWEFVSQKVTYRIDRAHFALSRAKSSKRVMDVGGSFLSNFTKIKRRNRGKGSFFNSLNESMNSVSYLESSAQPVRKKKSDQRLKSSSPQRSLRSPFTVTALAVDGDSVFSAGADATFKVWDLTAHTTKSKPKVVSSRIPIQSIISLGDGSGTVFILNDSFIKLDVEGLLYSNVTAPALMVSQSAPPGVLDMSMRPGPDDPRIVKRFENTERNLMNFNDSFITESLGLLTVGNGNSGTMFFEDESLPPLPDDFPENPTFEDVLKNVQARKRLLAILRRARAQENLEFYIAVKKYKMLFDKLSPKIREREARSILKRFVEVGSPREINISDQDKQKLLRLEGSRFSAGSFDEALGQVYGLMKANFFHIFLSLNESDDQTEGLGADEHDNLSIQDELEV